MQPQRILVAEDNAALATVIRFNLEQAGYHVTTVANGAAAWKLLQQESFDLLVTDYQMPHMSGEELCRAVRGEPRLNELAIFLLTAKRLELNLDALVGQLRIARTFVKPFSPTELIASVHEVLDEDCR